MHTSIQPNAHCAVTEVRKLSNITGLTTLTITEPGAGSGSDAHLTLTAETWQAVVNQLVAAGVVNPTEAQQVA